MNETVLIVDDTPSITEFIKYIIEEQGYTAITAENGTQGLAAAAELRPDIILLDIMLPDIDGYMICSQLKADSKTKDIPIIFLSALNSSFDKIKAFKCGAVDYVTKPVQTDELLARLKTHLTVSKLHKELVSTNRDLEDKVAERTQSLQMANENLNNLNQLLTETLLKYKEQKDKTENAEKTKNYFLTNVSQEIKKPMKVILQMANEIENKQADSSELVKYIKENTYSLLSIINNIIDYSAIETGDLKISICKTDISQILQNILNQNIEVANSKKLNLSINNDIKEEYYINTDPIIAEKILSNLTNNAIKFTTSGNIEIGASKSENGAVFFVSDTGNGISPAMFSSVFNPFKQENTQTNQNENGLGLALSKRYVEMLGGQLWFDSTPGKGSIFYISLPNIKEQKQEEQPILAGKTIIVGEDDDVSFILFNEITKKTGLKTIRAKTGRELYEQTRRNPNVNVIITNLKLPQMNGYEIISLIRKTNPLITILAQLPYFSASGKRDFAESGCDGFIEKPYNKQQLIDDLTRYIVPPLSNF